MRAGGTRYRAADAALRAGRLPVAGPSPSLLVAAVAVLDVVAAVLVLLRAW